MILRVLRSLLGQSRRDKKAAVEAERHHAHHVTLMRAVQMKVDALEVGAQRMDEERIKTEAAARVMLAKLREDFPQ